MEVVKIDDATWRIEDGFVRFFLLAGEKKALMIDSGVSDGTAKELAEGLTKLPIMLANTHGDGDHVAGTVAFDEIYMDLADFTGCQVDKRFPKTVCKPLRDGDLIDLGGRTIRAISIPGHTRGSLAFLDIEKRRLYSGDSVQDGHIYMFGDKRVPEQFEGSLEKLVNMVREYDSIAPSHGTPELPAIYAAKVLEAWRSVRTGKEEYREENLFGTKVKTYTTVHCGFYL